MGQVTHGDSSSQLPPSSSSRKGQDCASGTLQLPQAVHKVTPSICRAEVAPEHTVPLL